MGSDPIHSTGRGGAGNIGFDPSSTYADGGIVREGPEGFSDRPEYSAGRGGAGNMLPGTPKAVSRSGTPVGAGFGQPPPGSPRTGPVSEDHHSQMVVPETAMRGAEGQENFHTGRGGGGNVYKEKYGGHSSPQAGQEGHGGGLLDKAKHALGLDKGHKEEGSALKHETK